MNDVLREQLAEEMYRLYCSSRDFYQLSPIFNQFEKRSDYSIPAISKLTKIFMETKVEVPNLNLFMKHSELNSYQRMIIFAECWREAGKRWNN